MFKYSADTDPKLIARIQHFYEYMIETVSDIQEKSVSTDDKIHEMTLKYCCDEFNGLIEEYKETFSDIVYSEV